MHFGKFHRFAKFEQVQVDSLGITTDCKLITYVVSSFFLHQES